MLVVSVVVLTLVGLHGTRVLFFVIRFVAFPFFELKNDSAKMSEWFIIAHENDDWRVTIAWKCGTGLVGPLCNINWKEGDL